LKQGEKLKDVTKRLDLKGNHFVSLQLDGKDLKAGKDYKLKGEDLTIRASLLSNLNSKKLGRVAVLTAHFDSGANWYFNVYKYDTPVFADAQGTTSNFTIPLQFNGTQLRTMEAKYTDDGSNAGPQNWTSYKEFGYAFSPSYETNTVTFPYGLDRFFKDVADGREVELTFHFWSGEAITYKVTKAGDQVVGIALKK
jgi:endoglucanase